jgi:excinuclease ABC subunit A
MGLDEDILLLKNNKHAIDVVIDRLSINKSQINELTSLKTRLFDAVEQAVKLSEGLVILSQILDKGFELPAKPANLQDRLFSQKLSCPVDNLSFPQIEPRMFSFNSPHGACPTCTGLGSLLKIDEHLIINPRLTISEGGILPYANTFAYDSWFSQKIASLGIPMRVPINDLSPAQIKLLLYGTTPFPPPNLGGGIQEGGILSFEGLIPNLHRRYKQTESDFIRAEIEKFMRKEICPDCGGNRLKPEILKVTIAKKSIVDITNMSIDNTLKLISLWKSGEGLSDREMAIAAPILKEINERLGFLVSVGLDYLTLGRSAVSLAGGESQRIRLASQIGSGLSGVLYVLDEPSIGLHQRDNQRLIDTLKRLRDLGNSVIVVEHDREMMDQSDYIFDFGPGAGDHGGCLVAFGIPSEIKTNPQSLTGQYLSGKKIINITPFPPLTLRGGTEEGDTESNMKLSVFSASEHNLKNINIEFPLGKFIVVAGVSGSGKSTLLIDIVYHALAGSMNPDHKQKPGAFDHLSGTENINRVIMVDQSPIGRTPRSNPATYTGLFTPIRELFALSPEARVRGYPPGRFSFNVRGGRCENCQGEGQIKIEMQFLPDVYVDCDICHGTRYNSETLEVDFKGKNISQVLDMTVEEALVFFQSIPAVVEKLSTLKDVGLNYLRLGQPAPTLSGGEAQRVKLSTELFKRSTGKTFYILDEPTTGLHFADLEKLLNVLKKLTSSGNTVVVIEHNLDVIKNADWIIELGPEGGDKGGQLIASGTPRQLSGQTQSITGKYL